MQSGARQLADWLKKKTYKQNEAADLLNITEGYVSMLLSGERVPSRELAFQIEDLAGIPPRSWQLSPLDIDEAVGAGKSTNRKSNRQ